MINKLPPWIIAGGFILTLNAGLVNATTLSGFTGTPVSHMTGTVSNLARTLVQSPSQAGDWLFLLLFFIAGAVTSGLIIGPEQLRFGRRYGVALLVQSGLLCLSWVLFSTGRMWGEFLAAMACGLQNAMVSTYSGATIRTTHMTGIVSDIGSIIGNGLRTRKFERKKFLLLLELLAGFLSGSALGTWLEHQWSWNALLLPMGLAALAGAGYLSWRMSRHGSDNIIPHSPS